MNDPDKAFFIKKTVPTLSEVREQAVRDITLPIETLCRRISLLNEDRYKQGLEPIDVWKYINGMCQRVIIDTYLIKNKGCMLKASKDLPKNRGTMMRIVRRTNRERKL